MAKVLVCVQKRSSGSGSNIKRSYEPVVPHQSCLPGLDHVEASQILILNFDPHQHQTDSSLSSNELRITMVLDIEEYH